MESLPDDTRRLAARMATLDHDPVWAPWPPPVVLSSVGSTMSELRERAAAGAPAGTAIVADEQTAGRGRHGRTWQSPPGSGVWASVLVRPGEIDPATLGVLPLLIGSNLARELSQRSGARVQVKWPNDIVWADIVWSPGDVGHARETPAADTDGRPSVAKLAGILSERLADGAIVIGVGLNVLTAPVDAGAIALIDVMEDTRAAALTREDAAVDVLHAVARAASSWLRGDHDLADYRARCITVGRRVVVTDVAGGDSWSGTALDVDDTGLLLVEDAAGSITAVSAGDVTLAG